MTHYGYIVESCVLTTYSFVLLSLYTYQMRVEQSYRAKRSRVPDSSPIYVRILKDVKLSSLVAGIGASFFMTILSLDPAQANGILPTTWVHHLFNRVITFFLYWTGLAYSASALQASYVASKLIQSRPGRLTFNIYSFALFLYIPVLLFTTVAQVIGVQDRNITPLPFLVYVLSAQLCIIVAFDISFLKFRRKLGTLTKFESVGRAYKRLRRVFIFMHTGLIVIMLFQLWWIVAGKYKDHSRQDTERFTVDDQFGLYIQLSLSTFMLCAFWRSGGIAKPVELSDLDHDICKISDSDMDYVPTKPKYKSRAMHMTVTIKTRPASVYHTESQESVSLTPETHSPSALAIKTKLRQGRRSSTTSRSSHIRMTKRGSSDSVISSNTRAALQKLGISVIDVPDDSPHYVRSRPSSICTPPVHVRHLPDRSTDDSAIDDALHMYEGRDLGVFELPRSVDSEDQLQEECASPDVPDLSQGHIF